MSFRSSVLFLSASLIACFLCQAAPSEPVFDVASIRPSAGNVRPEFQTERGVLTIRNQSLLFITGWAYDIPVMQINAPPWMDEVRFDVMAKAEAGGDETKLRLMLRKLLADRFGFQTHNEQKEMQAYVMTQVKGGAKLQPSTDDGPPVFDSRGGKSVLTAHRVTMQDFAAKLSEPLRGPVLDQTGMNGKYEIRIDISGYMIDQNDASNDLMSLLFKGLQEQLGIKLTSKKDTVKLLVVDHAEKTPTEN
jgi:uncharacterized protein (TIGR03435 family)